MDSRIETLAREHALTKEGYRSLLTDGDPQLRQTLRDTARTAARRRFGNRIYTRGLIEFTNFCRNDCYYCGIRRSNRCVSRYRLSKEEILSCCREGYSLGFRTFVLQGGEDMAWTDTAMADVIAAMRHQYPDCAITLSIGERSRKSYELFFAAGATRYLLRHETADAAHYASLHPPELTLAHRKECLYTLKDIGYQIGAGFMVGSPGQTVDTLLEDLLFLQELQPHMVGIGPFIPQKDTPLGYAPAGSVDDTLFLLAILRLMLPQALLPATTALGTLDPHGREKGILSGANVVMPNLSPADVRKNYALYDNKLSTGEEAAQGWRTLQRQMEAIGYTLATERGDFGDR